LDIKIQLNGEPTILIHCYITKGPQALYVEPPIFFVAKKWQLKDKRFSFL